MLRLFVLLVTSFVKTYDERGATVKAFNHLIISKYSNTSEKEYAGDTGRSFLFNVVSRF